MKHLCDSNVFVALMLDTHPHHEAARDWMELLPVGSTACFCRATQQSFLRLLTVEAFLKEDVRTNNEAIRAMEMLLGDPRVEFIDREPKSLEAQWLEFSAHASPAPKRWMDAYLAAFAIGLGLRFVTFDRGFRHYRKPGLDLLLLGEAKSDKN